MANTFGYKIGWMAVKTDAPESIIDPIGLNDFSAVGWNEGIQAAYKGKLFITPVLNGWVQLVGDCDPVLEGYFKGHMMEPNPDYVNELLYYGMAQMSTIFAEVQFFYSHRTSGTYTYAKANEGKILRAFYLDLHSGNRHEIGEPSDLEIYHGGTQIDGLWEKCVEDLGEDLPSFMAGQWSIDPHTFNEPKWEWLEKANGLLFNGESETSRLNREYWENFKKELDLRFPDKRTESNT